jgi:hypothetical protein
MSLSIGRKGRVFIKKEVSYGVDPTLAAADAVRHVNIQMQFDPKARVDSPEKKRSPGVAYQFDRRVVANLTAFEGILRPSGTLNTVPELDPVLEALFGSETNVVLSTTITTGATTTVLPLTSVTGLAVGGAVAATIGTKKYVRVITDITGSDVTVAPALPSAPADGAAVKSCLVYKLTSDLAISLFVAHYLDGFGRNLDGVGIDQATITLDGTEEARISCSGPARWQRSTDDTDPAFAAEPGSFTYVGGNPPTGMQGELRVGDTAYLHKSLELTIANALAVRNEEAGNEGLATEVYRNGRRAINGTLEAFVETPGTLYAPAKAGTTVSLFRQNGWTEGNILALYMPRAYVKPASQDDGDEAVTWSFEFQALETADDENDELTLILG